MKILIIGAGITGATLAREFAEKGNEVLVLEKHDHVGGHAADEIIGDTPVSIYGPHIFHTDNKETWQFATRFAEFQRFAHTVYSLTNHNWMPWPINKRSIEMIFKAEHDIEYDGAIDCFHYEIDQARKKYAGQPENFETRAIQAIGETMYRTMIKNYSELQWQRPAANIPAEVFGRIRFKEDYDIDFFADEYVALPRKGYTEWISNMLDHKNINLQLNFNVALEGIQKVINEYHITFCSAAVDEIFGYTLGMLDYLKVKFEKFVGDTALHSAENWPSPVINHAFIGMQTTRATAYHRMYKTTTPVTVFEHPGTGEDLYPVRTLEAIEMHKNYAKLATDNGINLVGRLGSFAYQDMHVAIEKARKIAEEMA
ncbi:MAG TPA: FAD-dependent oxidoreductase [Cyclobacteriaceae bacterium]|nr:FAD-dependent oxidoreductase [Cyclobacteriaceae bacterium]